VSSESLYVIATKILEKVKRVLHEQHAMQDQLDYFDESSAKRYIEIIRRLEKIEAAVMPSRAVSFEMYQLVDGQEIRMDGPVKQKCTETVRYKVKPLDAAGNVTVIDSTGWSWALSNPANGSFANFAENGLEADLIGGGKVEDGTEIQFDGDAKVGEGVTPISGKGVVDFTPGDAVTFEISQA
jgi:hypothetical protein